MLTSRLNLPIPGGWTKDSGSPSAQELQNRELAAGIVGERGRVLDASGKPVARVVEGQSSDLVGSVVSSTGDILSSSGNVVGKAEPLSEEEQKDNEPEDQGKVDQLIEKAKSGSVVGSKTSDVTGDAEKTGSEGSKGAKSAEEPEPLGDQSKDLTEQAPEPIDDKNAPPGTSEKPSDLPEKPELPETSEKPTEAAEEKLGETSREAAPSETAEKPTSELGKEKPVAETTEAGAEAPSEAPTDEKTGESLQETPPSETVEKPTSELGEEKPIDETTEAGAEAPSEAPTAEKPGESLKETAPSETAEKPTSELGEEKPLDETTEAGAEAPSEAPTEEKTGETLKETAPSEIAEKPTSELGEEKPIDETTEAGAEVPSEAPTDEKPGESLEETAPSETAEKSTSELGEEKPVDETTEAGAEEVPEAPAEGEAEAEGEKIDFSVLKDAKVNKAGNLVDESNSVVGHIIEGNIKDLIGRKADENGLIWNDSGKVIGKAEPKELEEAKEPAPFEDFPDAVVESNGTVTFNDQVIGRVIEGDAEKLKGKKVDEDGDILDRAGNVIGKAERWEKEPEPEPEQIDFSILKDAKVNKAGNLIDDSGRIVGHIVEGNIKDLIGRKADENGEIWNDSGKVIGKAEPKELEEAKEPAPFEDFPDAVVESNGTVTFNDQVIGRVIEGDAEKLKGKKVDEDGDILDRDGNVIGKAERWEEKEPEPEPEQIDYSVLKDAKVNKAGNLVDYSGRVVGHIVEGTIKDLIGRKADENGEIWNDSGKVIGKAEPKELEEAKEPAPFEDFPDAVVESNGTVTFNDQVIGRVIEGDAKKLKGKKVDEDGDILDRAGNVIGKAERWEEEEPEPEPEVVIDRSILAGKRVNKVGNVVDTSGTIFGRLVEGDPKRLAGRMCDKEGNVRSESGDILGKAELVPEGEREGLKEGPFAELPGCTVTKDGKIVTPGGDVVGRLTQGDPKILFGRAVDEDGDILDRNGNILGKAERWEEPEVEKAKNPLEGRKVNREGNVVDAEGNIIGKLTSGELTICSGKEIDSDGDVVDSKGNTVGHVSLLADIPPETETPEEKAKREQEENDKKLAKQMAACITQCLDRIKPICKMITQKIEKADRTPKDELDEEDLVKEVKPLIEEGHNILQEANGIIRGLDPDGRIQANAKHKSATRDASPEEFHLADVLKELTGTVTECIENAKRKIEDMPHAKKELNPLWGLLTEPLFQIIAAVGLLLNGVLELVGRLLNGLGLGGLVNNILGGLGLTNVLKGLGIGGVVDALTGKTHQKKK
ncbi:hypothetical protein jhhlp_000661 [Lomentospora prolificans]|uniref:DUF6987 domain-containing protein n=1 Tax=Lomentospora prolificans TaxID=41688 RepID=A0A2N3NJ35_9PEZI|nr:hypothetical protein jhhlp_000661 [Lomentospora prolificans]